MSSFNISAMEKKARLRKNIRQLTVLSDEVCAEATVSRIENNRNNPTQKTLKTLLQGVGLSSDVFFSSYLVNPSIEARILHDKLLDCLDYADDPAALREAKRLFSLIDNMKEFKQGVNRQFLLSSKARIFEAGKCGLTTVISIVKQGMAVTFPEFSEGSFSGEMLIFEEIELLHTLSRTYRRFGHMAKALRLLENVLKGIDMLPEDDREKMKKYDRLLLTLSEFLIENGEYKSAYKICERGAKSTLKYNRGKYAPDFAHNKAVSLYKQGRTGECGRFFTLAYFGYALLQRRDKADKLKEDAEKLYGVTINTYGVESLGYKNRTFKPYVYGEPPGDCKSIGQLIRKLRLQNGLSQTNLCSGLCSEAYLYKIEVEGQEENAKHYIRGIKQPKFYILEALMQRLGRDINLYFDTFLSTQSFDEKQMRNEIIAQLILGKADEAEAVLNELETHFDYRKGSNLQFILIAKARLTLKREGYGEAYLKLVNMAIRITIPDFNDKEIYKYRLTYNEITLINMLALYYANNNEIPQAVRIYERLRDSINTFYVDEYEKIRMYALIMYNYSKYLGLMKRYDEALEIIAEGVAYDVRHSRLSILPSFMTNKACDLLEMGKAEASVPYFALAYYGAELLEKVESKNINANYVKERLNISFD
jgi:transcriptional regulator with XRE-family HTH domain